MTLADLSSYGLPAATAPPAQDRNDAAAYSPRMAGLEDFYPSSEAEHAQLVNWFNNAFVAADQARRAYEARWFRYYKLYRSYVQRKDGDWHHKTFWPICFYVIEAITPRLVQNLPKFTVAPVGPEDTYGARQMEWLLNYAATQSNMYVEMVKATKSSLKYGTGILKIFERQDTARSRKMVQGPPQPVKAKVDVPTMDPVTRQQMVSPDGQPLFETREVITGWQPGQSAWQPYTYTSYDGPACEAIDIFNFWVAPEAQDVQSARYVIQRVYKDMSHIERLVKEGVYKIPTGMSLESIAEVSDDPALRRLALIGLGPGGNPVDATRRPVELLECWTDDGRCMTMANRKAILRAHENPFDHGQKPYARIVDTLAEHEFWGIGEIEPIEGLQDSTNAISGQRQDNIRLVLNRMLAVNSKYIEDPRDLISRPGGIIRIKDDIPIQEAIMPIEFPDITRSAYQETAEIEQLVERVTGVSDPQLGSEGDNMPPTATAMSMLQEAGSSRFALKARLAELTGLRDVARQFGSLILQFMGPEKAVRILGPDGQYLFQNLTPESLAGAYDYDIESQSGTMTESQRRSDAFSLLQALAPFAPQALPKLTDDLLAAFDKHNPTDYLVGDPMLTASMARAQMANQEASQSAGPAVVGPGGVPQDAGGTPPSPEEQLPPEGGGGPGAEGFQSPLPLQPQSRTTVRG